MQQKRLILNYNFILPVLVVGIFSFFINYYYGFIGVMPMDNFVLYNGGYRVLKGYVPFNDYWLVTGPLLDYLNAFFFFINGTNWKSFIIHSSLFNSIISIVTYFIFICLKLPKKYAITYSIFFSILFYPVVGTPFVDHHSTFFVILAFYFFIFGLNKNENLYFVFIPFLFVLAFLSKQTPAVYGLFGILILFTIFIFFDLKKNIKILIPLVVGSIISVSFFIMFIFFTKINFINFIEQYILYAKTIGDFRFATYKFDFFGTVAEYKFILILLIFLSITLIRLLKENNAETIFSILTIIVLSCLLIFHQYYSLNQNYIFFLIPLIAGIIHTFYKKSFTNNYILPFVILVCVYSTVKYHLRFNEHRKFNELEKVDISKAIDAEILTQDLKGLKWITYYHPNNPEYEINNLIEAMDILSKEKSKKMIITDYQFIAAALNIYDFSPNQWHHPSVSFPVKNQKYFNEYKSFFIKNLKKNSIDFIYETSETEDSIVEKVISKNCVSKERMSKMLVKFMLNKNCKDFK